MLAFKLLDVVVLAIPFFAIIRFFPSGGWLTADDSLMNFWTIPLFFLVVRGFLGQVQEDRVRMPKFIFYVLSRLSMGAGCALTLGAVLILNAWYADPDNGQWEPWFTAIGSASAVILFLGNWFRVKFES